MPLVRTTVEREAAAVTTPRRWLSGPGTAPLGVQLLLAVSVCVAGSLLGRWLASGGPESRTQALVQGVVTGTVLVGVLRLGTRMSGGPEASSAAQRALRRRTVPPDVDPEVLQQGLVAVRRVTTVIRWWLPVACLLLAGSLVLLPGADDSWVLWVPLVAVAAVSPRWLGHRLRRIDSLLDDLDRRQAAPPT